MCTSVQFGALMTSKVRWVVKLMLFRPTVENLAQYIVRVVCTVSQSG